MEKGNKNRYICLIHDDIKYLCKELLELISDDRLNKKRMISKINKIIKISGDAKTKGQTMENRLQDYRFTIESLGFKRKR